MGDKDCAGARVCQLFSPSPRDPRLCTLCLQARPHHILTTPQEPDLDWAETPLPATRTPSLYDVRAEYISKAAFRAKFGQYPQVPGDESEPGGSYSDSECLRQKSLYSSDDEGPTRMPGGPILLSPSATSAFDDYRLVKKSPSLHDDSISPLGQKILAKVGKKGGVSFGAASVICSEGGIENMEMEAAEEDGTSGNQDLAEDDFDFVVGNSALDCLTGENTAFNSDLDNFRLPLRPPKVDENGNSELASEPPKEDNNNDPPLSPKKQARPKLKPPPRPAGQTADDSQCPTVPNPPRLSAVMRSESVDAVLVPAPRRPRKPQAPPPPLDTTPLMRSFSQISPSMREDFTLSLSAQETSATIVTLKGEDVPTSLVVESGDATPVSDSHSPSPGRELSDLSDNHSESSHSFRDEPEPTRVVVSTATTAEFVPAARPWEAPSGGFGAPKVPKQVDPGLAEKLRRISRELEETTRSNDTSSPSLNMMKPQPPQRAAAPNKPANSIEELCQCDAIPERPQVSAGPSSFAPPEAGPINLGAQSGVFESLGRARLPALSAQGMAESDFLDIAVCQHVGKPGRAASRAASLDRSPAPLDEAPKSRGRRNKWSSLRRFFVRSSSQPASLREGRDTRLFHTVGKNSRLSGSGLPGGLGIEGMFHSLHEPCNAAEQEISSSRSGVIVKDICDTTIVRRAPRSREPTPRVRVSAVPSVPDSLPPTPTTHGQHRPRTSPTPVAPAVEQDSHRGSPNPAELASRRPPLPSLKPSVSFEDSLRPPPRRPQRAASQIPPSPSLPAKLASSASAEGGPNLHSRPGIRERSSPAKAIRTERKKEMEDRYKEMALSHLSTLAFLSHNFPTITQRWALSGVYDPEKLRWADFSLPSTTPILVKDCAVFYAATLKQPGSQEISCTVMISPLRFSNPLPRASGAQPFLLPSLGELTAPLDATLVRLAPAFVEEEPGPVTCKVTLLPDAQLGTLDSWADLTAARHNPLRLPALHEKETTFLLLQLISALKFLQAQGIEELAPDFDGFLLLQKEGEPPQLLVLWDSLHQGNRSGGLDSGGASSSSSDEGASPRLLSLCQAALAALCMLLHCEIPLSEILRERVSIPFLPNRSLFSEGLGRVASVLQAEKASSLSQAKALLEYLHWITVHKSPIPVSATINGGSRDGKGQPTDVEAIAASLLPSPEATMPSLELGGFSGPAFSSEWKARLWLDSERARTATRLVRRLLCDSRSLGSNVSPPSRVLTGSLLDEYRLQFLLHASVRQLFECAQSLESPGDVVL